MRKNPYNKDLKGQLPLFMQGPSTTTFLTKNEEQKVVLEKGKTLPPVNIYQVRGKSFAMVKPPFLNLSGTMNPTDLLNIEMGQTEVTQELFKAVMRWNSSQIPGNPQLPVRRVTWFDCISFCNKLSEILGFKPCYKMLDVYEDDWEPEHIDEAKVTWDETLNGFRLPKFEEWVIFAKAGTQNQWAGTNVESELDKYAWYGDNSGNKTHPVGEKLPNEWGLYDMTGNVREWCWDKVNPSDEDILAQRVYSASSSISSKGRLSSDSYHKGNPGETSDARGFRICRTIK